MRYVYIVFAYLIIMSASLHRVFGEQERAVNPISCLQNPITLPLSGLKYKATATSTVNGRALATVNYDFDLRPTSEPGSPEDRAIALLVPSQFTRSRPGLAAAEVLPAQACIIHLTQALVQSTPVSSPDAKIATSPISIPQQEIDDQIIGLLLFRLETVSNPTTQATSGAKMVDTLPMFMAKSASPRIPLSGVVVRNIATNAIDLDFKDVANSGIGTTTKVGVAASAIDGADFDQRPYSGSCEVDVNTGWVDHATIERVEMIGTDKYVVQVSIRAVHEVSDGKDNGGTEAHK